MLAPPSPSSVMHPNNRTHAYQPFLSLPVCTKFRLLAHIQQLRNIPATGCRVSLCMCSKVFGFRIWISKHRVSGFLCILSAVCDNFSGAISHPEESPYFIPRERVAFAPLKKWIYTTTCTRTQSLNINDICLVTKHELSVESSAAFAQVWERGQPFSQMEGFMAGTLRGGEFGDVGRATSKTDQESALAFSAISW